MNWSNNPNGSLPQIRYSVKNINDRKGVTLSYFILSASQDLQLTISIQNNRTIMIRKALQAVKAVEALRSILKFPNYIESFCCEVNAYFENEYYGNEIRRMFDNSYLFRQCEGLLAKLKEPVPSEWNLLTKIQKLVEKANLYNTFILAISNPSQRLLNSSQYYKAYLQYQNQIQAQDNKMFTNYEQNLEKIENLKNEYDYIIDNWSIFQNVGVKFEEKNNRQILNRLRQIVSFIQMKDEKFKTQIDSISNFIQECANFIQSKSKNYPSLDFLLKNEIKNKCSHLALTVNNLMTHFHEMNKSQMNMKRTGHIIQSDDFNFQSAVNFINRIQTICRQNNLKNMEGDQKKYKLDWPVFQCLVIDKFQSIFKIQNQNKIYQQFIEDICRNAQMQQTNLNSTGHRNPEKLKQLLLPLKDTLASKLLIAKTSHVQCQKYVRSDLAYRARIYPEGTSEIQKEEEKDPTVKLKLDSLRQELTKEYQIKLSNLRDELDEKDMKIIDKDKEIAQLKESFSKQQLVKSRQKEELIGKQNRIQELIKRIQDLQSEMKLTIESISNQNKILREKQNSQANREAFNTDFEKPINQKQVFNQENNHIEPSQPQIKIFTPSGDENKLFPSVSAFNQSQQFISKLLQQIRTIKESSPLRINMLFSSTISKSPETRLITNKSNILLVFKTDFNTIMGGFTDYPFYNSNTIQEFKQSQKRSFLFSSIQDRFVSLPLLKLDGAEPNSIACDMLLFGKSEIRLNMNSSYRGKVVFKLGEEEAVYSSGQNFRFEEFVGVKLKEANINVLQIFEFIYEETKHESDTKSEKKQRKASDNIENLIRVKSNFQNPSRLEEKSPLKLNSLTNNKVKDHIDQRAVDHRIMKLQIEFAGLKEKNEQMKLKIEELTYKRDEAIQEKLVLQTQLEDQINTLEFEINKLNKTHENAVNLQKKTLIEEHKKKIHIIKAQNDQEKVKLNDKIDLLKKEMGEIQQRYKAIRDKLMGKSLWELSMSMICKKENQEQVQKEEVDESYFTVLNQQEKQDVEKIKEELRKQFEKQIDRVNQQNNIAKAQNERISKEQEQYKKHIQELKTKIVQLQLNKTELSNKVDVLSKFEGQADNLRRIKIEYETVLAKTIENPTSLKLSATSISQQYVHYSQTFLNADIFQRNEEDKICLLTHINKYMKKRVIKTRLLYKFDPKNNTNVHHYIDNKRGLLCVVKTANAIIAGFYPGSLAQRGVLNEGGLLISVTNNTSFPLFEQNQRAEPVRCTYRGMTYDTFYVIFGNAQMRIRTGQKRVFSNFGISSSYFNNGGKRVNSFLNEGDQREVEFEYSEYYQIFFDQENIYRPEERLRRFC